MDLERRKKLFPQLNGGGGGHAWQKCIVNEAIRCSGNVNWALKQYAYM